MKKQSLLLTFCLLLCLGGPEAIRAQSKAINYQGRLTENGMPANGQYQMRFRVFAEPSPAGGQVLATSTQSVSVVNGLFTAMPEFIEGPDTFDGGDRWLEIGVAGIDNPDLFTALVPRQIITRVPYALYSAAAGGPVEGAPWNFGEQVTFNASNGPPFSVVSSTKITGLNGDQLDGLDSSAFWKLTGNSGTTPGANFLGTADNQPLELKVNNTRVLRLEPAGGNPNVIGGYNGNVVSNGFSGATISGGGASGNENRIGASQATVGGGDGNISSGFAATVGGGERNTSRGFFATVSGGVLNRSNSDYGTVGGGALNTSSGDYGTVGGGFGNTSRLGSATVGGGSENYSGADYATVGGGSNNYTSGTFATVGGGTRNTASSEYTTVGGGGGNTSSGDYATVGGGDDNVANGVYATIPGGRRNLAEADYTFAAGNRAEAIHAGAFVWADSQSANFSSTDENQFLIRASGGVGIGTPNPKQSLHNSGDYYGRGHLWLHAYEGDGNDGIAYVQARDDTASSSIALQLRTKAGNSVSNVMRLTAGGRVGIGTTTPTTALQVIGTVTATAFNPPSDRNLKENFIRISPREVLDKVAALTITRWNFKSDSATPHLGPMAQDFHAAFGLGTDDKHISTVDADGVALAAIQGLNQKVEDALKQKDAEVSELKSRLHSLEKLLHTLATK